MSKRITIIFITILCFIGVIINACVVKAQDTTFNKMGQYMDKTREGAGYAEVTEGKNDITAIIANVIQISLAFVGAIFFILILWGGNEWLTAGGNEEKIAKAKKLFLHSALGLVIVLVAYLVTHLLITVLIGATGI